MSQSSGEKKHSTIPIVDDALIKVAKMVETMTIVGKFLPPQGIFCYAIDFP